MWKYENMESKENKSMNMIRMKMHHAQKVRKVLISRKNLLILVGVILDYFSHGSETTNRMFCRFSLVSQ